MKKLISIVLPIYNVENYIEKCMERTKNNTGIVFRNNNKTKTYIKTE